MPGQSTSGPKRAAKRGPKGRPTAPKRQPARPPTRRLVPPTPAQRAGITRTIYRAGAAFLALGVLLGAAYWYSTKPRPLSAEAERLIAQAPAAARAAGCTAVRTIAPYDPSSLDRAHIGGDVPTMPPLSSYPSVPPASGPHDPVPVDAGVRSTPPPIAGAIHSLEHGAVLVWYAPSAGGPGPIGTFFAIQANRDHVIVAPYDYPDQGTAGRLPPGVGMALVAWHRLQTCATPSLPVAAAFAQRFASPSQPVPFARARGYEGDAPEAGAAI